MILNSFRIFDFSFGNKKCSERSKLCHRETNIVRMPHKSLSKCERFSIKQYFNHAKEAFLLIYILCLSITSTLGLIKVYINTCLILQLASIRSLRCFFLSLSVRSSAARRRGTLFHSSPLQPMSLACER